jgi:hypothetical protein
MINVLHQVWVIVAFSEGFVVENRQTIINFAMSRRLPVVSGWAVMAKSGALLTYGPRLIESYRRPAYYVGRILRGAKPSELPIERPTRVGAGNQPQQRQNAWDDDPAINPRPRRRGHWMRRRELMLLLGGRWRCRVSSHAEREPMPVIGYLNSTSPGPTALFVAEFRQGLSETGYVGSCAMRRFRPLPASGAR